MAPEAMMLKSSRTELWDFCQASCSAERRVDSPVKAYKPAQWVDMIAKWPCNWALVENNYVCCSMMQGHKIDSSNYLSLFFFFVFFFIMDILHSFLIQQLQRKIFIQPILYARPCSKHFVCTTTLIPHNHLLRYYYYFYFTNKDNDAQVSKVV